MRIIKIIIIFLVLFWAGAAFLEKFTLWKTNGECSAMFNCVCPKIGPGICDGYHDYNGIGR